jgi:tetratricopeptide (TPR) repeat protein
MRKNSILILAFTVVINIMTLAQNCALNNLSSKQIVYVNPQLKPSNDGDLKIYLSAIQTDSMNEMLDMLSKFINTNSSTISLDEYTKKGLSFNSLKNYDSALYYYSLAIKLSAHNPYLYYFRGDTYSNKHDYISAIDDFSSAIYLDQNFYMAYYFRGICFYALGDLNRAMEDISMTFKLVKASLKTA